MQGEDVMRAEGLEDMIPMHKTDPVRSVYLFSLYLLHQRKDDLQL
jgi:hypothetical protein